MSQRDSFSARMVSTNIQFEVEKKALYAVNVDDHNIVKTKAGGLRDVLFFCVFACSPGDSKMKMYD